MGVCISRSKGCIAVCSIPESALASLEVMENKRPKGQGVCRAWGTSFHALGGSWALLALILPYFFAFVVSIDLLSIFYRFQRGFGMGLGGPNGKKIEILAVF